MHSQDTKKIERLAPLASLKFEQKGCVLTGSITSKNKRSDPLRKISITNMFFFYGFPKVINVFISVFPLSIYHVYVKLVLTSLTDISDASDRQFGKTEVVF